MDPSKGPHKSIYNHKPSKGWGENSRKLFLKAKKNCIASIQKINK